MAYARPKQAASSRRREEERLRAEELLRSNELETLRIAARQARHHSDSPRAIRRDFGAENLHAIVLSKARSYENIINKIRPQLRRVAIQHAIRHQPPLEHRSELLARLERVERFEHLEHALRARPEPPTPH